MIRYRKLASSTYCALPTTDFNLVYNVGMTSQDDSQQSQDSVMTLIEEDRQEILYFAYGSNLSTAQMRQRCPYSMPIGLGFLPGWRWTINERGFANAVQLPASSTGTDHRSVAGQPVRAAAEGIYGLLYLLPPGDEAALDSHEGVPWAYEKYQCDVWWIKDDKGMEQDSMVRALVYIDVQRVGEGAPREEYVDRMERAIEDAVDNWGMDEDYADVAMRRFWPRA